MEVGKVLAYMVTRASTPQRLKVLEESIAGAFETAGYKFDLLLYCNSNPSYTAYVADKRFTPISNVNVGQHVCFNEALQYAENGDYDFLLRLDDDIQFLSKNWLAKMVKAYEDLNGDFILSPTVKGLTNPIPMTAKTEYNGVPIKLAEIMGGICRLHPVDLLLEKGYVSDVRKPLGFGDAVGIGTWAQDNMVWLAYLQHVRVKHAGTTKGQAKTDPVYHSMHDVFQVLPYMPDYVGEENV